MEKYKLKAIDLRLLEDVFVTSPGYVLDFSNKSFAEFFELELGVNIYAEKYGLDGNSKAKRLRCFLKLSPPKISANAIVKLWNLREVLRSRSGQKERFSYAKNDIQLLVARLRTKSLVKENIRKVSQRNDVDKIVRANLSAKLLEVSDLPAHQRGFAFEKFLNAAFEAYGLMPRSSFKLTGEQIDGSFVLNGQTYLLEAKWQKLKSGATDLYAFNGKVENKTTWTRGLFISYTGFSETGVEAFSKSKSIICMDGLDLHSSLKNEIGLPEIITQKVRRASETGQVFIPFKDL